MHNLNANDRRRNRRAPSTSSLDEATLTVSAPANQEDGLHLESLRRVLAALPEDQRAVILLVGLEQFSYGEAAAILGVPAGTVMSRLHRGREQLRRQLAGGTEPNLRRVK